MRKKRKPHHLNIAFLVLLACGLFFLYLTNRNSTKNDIPKVDLVNFEKTKDEDSGISAVIVPEIIHENEDLSVLRSKFNYEPKNIVLLSKSKKESGLHLSSANSGNDLFDRLSVLNLDTDDSANTYPEDINKLFPKSEKLFLTLGSETSYDEIIKYVTEIQKNLSVSDSTLIVSGDIAENAPYPLNTVKADFIRDKLTSLDSEALMRSDDARGLFQFAIEWANKTKFNIYNHVKTDCSVESKCGIIGYYGGEIQTESRKSTTFVIGGDTMTDRGVNYTYPEDRIFELSTNLLEVFSSSDFSFVNLEGPISPRSIDNLLSYSMSFNLPPKTADLLKLLNINGVSLANNHTNNNGITGLSNTRAVLKEKNIAPVGEESKFNSESVALFRGGYQNVRIIAINCLEVSCEIDNEIGKYGEDFVIIMPHWGEEYKEIHNQTQEKFAHAWIDAGADLIVGTHPHVIQDAEIYQGKAIFYSLGNLIFDQTWSTPTQRGLILAGQVGKEGVEIVLLPTKSNKLKPELLNGEERAAALSKFNNLTDISSGGLIIIPKK